MVAGTRFLASLRRAVSFFRIDSNTNSTVPSAKDVLVPETLLKKRKTDAKLREEKQAKAAELRKVRANVDDRVCDAEMFAFSSRMMHNHIIAG